MRHDLNKFPYWKNEPREAISEVFAPYSGYCYVSLAKTSRDSDSVSGNSGPIFCSRNRPVVHPKKRSGRNLHGRKCSDCNPRQGRPRKPYKRANENRLSDGEAEFLKEIS